MEMSGERSEPRIAMDSLTILERSGEMGTPKKELKNVMNNVLEMKAGILLTKRGLFFTFAQIF